MKNTIVCIVAALCLFSCASNTGNKDLISEFMDKAKTPPCPEVKCPEAPAPTPCPQVTPSAEGISIQVAVVDVEKLQVSPAVLRIKNKIGSYPNAGEFSEMLKKGDTTSERYLKLKKDFTATAVNLTNQATELIRVTIKKNFSEYPTAIMDKGGNVMYSKNGPAFFKGLVDAGTIHIVSEDITDKVLGFLQ